MISLKDTYDGQSIKGLGLFVLMAISLIVAHIWSVFFLELNWAMLLAAITIILFQCWLFTGVFIVAHDAMHGTLTPRWPRLNDAIGAVILFLYAGFTWRIFKAAHLAHHKAPGSIDDPDFNDENPIAFWPWYVKFFKTYFGLRSVTYVVSVTLIYGLLFGANFINIWLFYGVPSILSSVQLFYFGTYLPHRHEVVGFADHHNARTNDYPKWLSLLTCYHFGYHHEHHITPQAPWWRLPAEREMRA